MTTTDTLEPKALELAEVIRPMLWERDARKIAVAAIAYLSAAPIPQAGSDVTAALELLIASTRSVLVELKPGEALRPAGASKTNILISDVNEAERALRAIARAASAPEAGPEDWRCSVCGWCREYARVDERKPNGRYGPGPLVRCVNCKAESLYPDTAALPPEAQPVAVKGLEWNAADVAETGVGRYTIHLREEGVWWGLYGQMMSKRYENTAEAKAAAQADYERRALTHPLAAREGDGPDLLAGMVGLVDILLGRDDLPGPVAAVLRTNHRIVDARAALTNAGGK